MPDSSQPKTSSHQISVTKHLLIVTPYFHPHLGGVEKHVLKTTQHLQQIWQEQGQDWQVDIITRQHKPSLPNKEQFRQNTIHRFSYPDIKLLGLLAIWWQMLTRFWHLFKRADVVHVHDVMIWLLPLRWLLPKTKFVLTMHGWEGVFPIPRKNKWLKKISATLAHRVFCVGDYIGKYYGINCNQVIYGGVEPEQILQPVQVKAKHQLQPKEKIKLVYVGRLAEDTGLPMLLKAIKQLPKTVSDRYQFIFIGDGKLQTECQAVGQVLGWLQPKQVQQELTKAQMCFAGGYLTALEGVAAGCVVLVGGGSQIKQDYWSSSPFTKTINTFCTYDELSDYLMRLKTDNISLNKNKIIKNYSWQKIGKLYISNFFFNILNKSN